MSTSWKDPRMFTSVAIVGTLILGTIMTALGLEMINSFLMALVLGVGFYFAMSVIRKMDDSKDVNWQKFAQKYGLTLKDTPSGAWISAGLGTPILKAEGQYQNRQVRISTVMVETKGVSEAGGTLRTDIVVEVSGQWTKPEMHLDSLQAFRDTELPQQLRQIIDKRANFENIDSREGWVSVRVSAAWEAAIDKLLEDTMTVALLFAQYMEK